ncbi:DUF6455 family protein [Rhizobium sp. G187]|uniref:DUF6455 family protein n=1 Tax=Rhizobium sp. G187 TaxID=3451352 RepID=UPI003EE664C2
MSISLTDPIRQGFHHLLTWCGTGFEATAEADLLANLDETQLAALAEDCGLTPHEMLALAKAGPHAADEMPRLMRALNIDPAEVEFRMRKLFRSMQVTCANCSAKQSCRHDLDNGHAETVFASYCGNADLMNSLRVDPELLVER